MKYSKMLLTHKILKGRVSGEDLYTGNLKNIEGKDLGLIEGFDSIAERVENWLK